MYIHAHMYTVLLIRPYSSTHFLMLSISLEMLSSSLMAEKSLPNPNPLPSLLPPFSEEVMDAPHTLDVVVVDVAMVTVPRLAVAKLETLVGAEEATPTPDVETDAAYTFLKEGGIIAGVRSFGRGFPLTFSATRNMANANCSALSRPVLEISQRFLGRYHRQLNQ